MKQIIHKKSVFFLIFIFTGISVFSDSYDEAIKYLNKNNVEKSLSYFYKYLKSGTEDENKIIISLNKIIHNEKDINKIISSVENYSDVIKQNKKEKSRIFLNAAELAELSGKTEKAVHFYISSYNEHPDPENSSSLLISAGILLDNGEFAKAENQLLFYKKLSLNRNNIYRAEILESIIKILSGNRAEGEKIISEIVQKKDISEKNLSAAVLIAHNYNLENVITLSKKMLIEKNKNADISSLLTAGPMLSPASFFNYSNTESRIKITDEIKSDELIFLQTGSYSNIKNAENMSSRLKKIGFKSEIIKKKYKGKNIFKVMISAESKEKAQEYHIKLKENSIESFMVFD